MVDETTDVAAVKELIIYARYLKASSCCTECLTVLLISSGTADCILTTLQHYLQELDIPFQKMHAIGSDGPAVMLGRRNGVTAQLRRQVSHLSNHCMVHKLALAAGQAAKSIHYVPKFKDILGQLLMFYSNSDVRINSVHQIQELHNEPVLKLSQAIDVRWLSHDKGYQDAEEVPTICCHKPRKGS